jgi:hypothetical protein
VGAAAAAAAALTLVPAAGASQTYYLGWREFAVVKGSGKEMLFRVGTLTVNGSAWSVSASFASRSSKTLGLRPNFELLVGRTETQTHGLTVLRATAYSPAPPRTLAPGASWSGTFSGRGAAALVKGRFVHVSFGWFVGRLFPDTPGFAWVTDNVKQL